MPSIVQILISDSPESEMRCVSETRAIWGRGLEGDRYFYGAGTFSPKEHKPDYEVTLIEQEKVDAFARESGLPFTPHQARRNLVTQGLDLNSLVGRQFMVGEACLRGVRLCEPCNYLAKLTYPAVLEGLVHKGGLRAAIVSGGIIRQGDSIRVED